MDKRKMEILKNCTEQLKNSRILENYIAIESGEKKIDKNKTAPVLFVGETGTGKTSGVGKIEAWEDGGKIKSLGLPPSKTLLINLEDKPLLTRNAGDFAVLNIRSPKQYELAMKELYMAENPPKEKEHFEKWRKRYIDNPSLKVFLNKDFVVIDSGSSLSSMVYNLCNFKANNDTWKSYNLFKTDFPIYFESFKKLKSQIFVTALPADEKEMGKKQHAGIEGKKLNGYMESNFSVVLWTNPEYSEKHGGRMMETRMQYWSNNRTSAKSPAGMFSGNITNDMFNIALEIQKFFGAKQWD